MSFKHRPKFVSKTWGYELWIHNAEDYCSKVLRIHKGFMLSYHYHNIKSETFYLQEGLAVVACSTPAKSHGQEGSVCRFPLYPGEAIELPPTTRHGIVALEDCTIFEASTQHFDEDSIRLGSSKKLDTDELDWFKRWLEEQSTHEAKLH